MQNWYSNLTFLKNLYNDFKGNHGIHAPGGEEPRCFELTLVYGESHDIPALLR